MREILEARPGERLLEIGPGTGYYTLDLAEWVGPDGSVEILDVQQEMLDHTIRRARERGLWNVNPTLGDARRLEAEDDSFDAVVLVTVLGEIPDQDAALREIARVLRPGGRLVVGELIGDPHMVSLGSLRRRAEAAGLRFERRVGPKIGYFARLAA
jgi:ubiquinone/menaquinone biosynthesis C-methylase UbiE